MDIVIALVALAACALLGMGIALGVANLGQRHDPHNDEGFVSDGFNATISAVGGLLAFVLGFLVVFTLDNYSTASQVATDEANAYGQAFESAVLLPPEQSAPLKRDIACLIRSVANEADRIGRGGEALADDEAEAWWSRTRAALAGIAEAENAPPFQEFATESIFSNLQDARAQMQQRILLDGQGIPNVVWLMIYVAFTGCVVITVVAVRRNPYIMAVSVITLTVVTGSVIAALLTFNTPFEGTDGTGLNGDELRAIEANLTDNSPGPWWEPCEKLVP